MTTSVSRIFFIILRNRIQKIPFYSIFEHYLSILKWLE